jgi:hypothetical protein
VAQQAGFGLPFPAFRGTVAQALRPYPQVLNIGSQEDKLGSSTYHSLQTKAQKRFAAGFQFLASYTWSKLMTNVQGGVVGLDSSSLQNGFDRRAEWAIATQDTPHNLWISTIYEIRGFGSRVSKAVFGGWGVSLVVNYQSGVPLRINQANRLNIFNTSQRPDRVLGIAARNDIAYADFDPARDRLFNPNAFTPATTGFGNASPRLADARGFGIRREDVSIKRNFRFTERVNLEFNIQSFNIFNRNQWGKANDNLSSADFGRLTLAGPGRFVQLGARLRF